MSNSKCVGHWFLKKVIKGLVLCEFCCIHCAVHFLFSIASLSSPFTSCFLLFHCAPCSLFVFYYFTELAVHFSFSVISLSSPFTSCFLLLHWAHHSLLVFYYSTEFTVHCLFSITSMSSLLVFYYFTELTVPFVLYYFTELTGEDLSSFFNNQTAVNKYLNDLWTGVTKFTTVTHITRVTSGKTLISCHTPCLH